MLENVERFLILMIDCLLPLIRHEINFRLYTFFIVSKGGLDVASDSLYINDVSSDFHYCVFSDNYFTLYNKPSARNETLQYYRFYPSLGAGFYVTGYTTFNNYTTTFTDVTVSNSFFARTDAFQILRYCFMCCFILYSSNKYCYKLCEKTEGCWVVYYENKIQEIYNIFLYTCIYYFLFVK